MKHFFVLLFLLSLHTNIKAQVQVIKTNEKIVYHYEPTGSQDRYELVIINTYGNDPVRHNYLLYAPAFTIIKHASDNKPPNLSSVVPYLDTLLSVMHKDHPEVELRSLEIAPPLYWEDVLVKHIKAFGQNKEWIKNGVIEKVVANAALMSQIMLEEHVYSAIEPVLKKSGYEISGINGLSIGLYGPKLLKREAGYIYTGKPYIPMPNEFSLSLKKQKND